MDGTRGASARLRIGPAGWSHKDWAGQVYPQPQPRGFDPLRCLARYFEAIEINATFYRIPDAKTAQASLTRATADPGGSCRSAAEGRAGLARDRARHPRGGEGPLNTPEIRGLGIVLDGFTGRWKATGEVDGVGWLEAWGRTLVEAMEALQAKAASIVQETGTEEGGS
jgi:hypothetical protein